MPGVVTEGYVLPEQLLGESCADSGERRLALAILEDAVLCIRRMHTHKGRRDRRLARETMDWVQEDDLHWPFSFMRLCEYLDLDPSAMRRAFRQMQSVPPAMPFTRRRGRVRFRGSLQPPTVRARERKVA